MPLRPELEQEAAAGCDKATAVAELNAEFGVEFAAGQPIVLVMGGSQGASIFNRNLPAALTSCGVAGLQVIHLCGPGKLAEAKAAYNGSRLPLLLLEYSDRMALFLACADLVFARSGGSTIAELGLFGKPAVLSPYPYAAEGHQTDNARFYVESGCGVLLSDDELTVERAAHTVGNLFSEPGRLEAMSKAARAAARPHAADTVIEMISNSVGTIL
ncbi:MAG: UDP-N-acetylglucosamine--N-acetylmuramyl-(pentapeptide) pyrophosphoryl-undecaprenol N-acetylglucosamine transferase, partial [Victivallaceae bacterium]|nr:UDP-N-acetylglucosamine--N-acetylmuramyl-(pentapeptide) pyrophosphoryl-undecaprenol N-acetylglucosamine transferase [Victivallaceae bacterium]